MAMEVNTRQCISAGEEKQFLPHKSPRKIRVAGSRTRSNEQVDKPIKHEEEYGARTSVFQGKVKALKERHMKDRKEARPLEGQGGEKQNSEDALVSPQLRTYLTEELLDSSKHSGRSGAHRGGSRGDRLVETYNIDGSSDSQGNGCKTIPPNHRENTKDNSISKDLPEKTTEPDSISLTLAERVERNRQELRSKFGKSGRPGGELNHHRTPSQGVITGEEDGDLEVEVAEDCGELSARHEQAKQLLQRARMKAKGASPLRASHCVLQHPHSQPTLRRGPSISGVLTDGGSLSDSSSSEYSSWHKSSRGSSPSHVRFQDESEREAEERYRERQQVPQKVSTPPPKRQSNGPISWTEQLPPSGHGTCGSCGSYLKGTGASPSATHCTNLRNVHLGSKMTQDGSVGVKPSPHWILPSQPWRMYTELIRETHIGSDSTPDSSGDDDGNGSHKKKSREAGMHRHCRNNSANADPEQGFKKHPPNTSSESEIKMGRSHNDQNNRSRNSTASHIGQSKSSHMEPMAKTSESSMETGNYDVNPVRSGLRKSPQHTDTKPTRKHKTSSAEFSAEHSPSTQETRIGDVVLNIDCKQGSYRMDEGRTPVMDCMSVQGSPSLTSGHVPAPPSGKAPIMMPSRSRLTLRQGGISQQPHSQDRDTVQASNHKREPLPEPNPKKPTQTLEASDPKPSTQGMTSKDHRSRERTPKLKKHVEHTKTIHDKVNGDFIKHQEHGRANTSVKQRDCDRRPSFKDQRDLNPTIPSKDQEKSRVHHHPNREEQCTEKSGINGKLGNSNTNPGSGQCSRENSFHCQTSVLGTSAQDRYPDLADEGTLQPVIKKGDIRSGMRKIFSTIGLASRPKLARFQSSSLEQIPSADHIGGSTSAHGDNEPCDGSMKPGKIKKSPSLQSLKLMSPFHLPRKSSSVQNLLGKSDRSSVYITGDTNTAPRRALSVEDIGSPGEARVLGKVAEVYADGTRLLQLQRPEGGTFGFRISSGNGRPDSGVYVQEMSDDNTAKLYSGLLRVGDEVLEVNGTKVSILGQIRLAELLNREPVLALRVLHQRRTKC